MLDQRRPKGGQNRIRAADGEERTRGGAVVKEKNLLRVRGKKGGERKAGGTLSRMTLGGLRGITDQK